MVAAHVDTLCSLLQAVCANLDRNIAIECRHFFSGAAAYANGRIFMTLTDVGMALKLPQSSRAELCRVGAKPLRYFPNGPIKKDYVIVAERMARDISALAPWIVKSIQFSQTLPAPRRARKAPRRAVT